MTPAEFLVCDLSDATVSADGGVVSCQGHSVRLWPPAVTPDDEIGWALANLVASSGAGTPAFSAVSCIPRAAFAARNIGQGLAFDWVLFFAASPMAADALVASNPALAWLAVRSKPPRCVGGVVRHVPVEETIEHYRSLLCLKRFQLLEQLHLTPTKGLLKLLSRCSAACAADIFMNELLAAVEPVGNRRWSAQILFSLARITPDTLTLIRQGREFVGPRLIQQTQRSGDHEVTWLVQTAKALWRERDQPYPWKDLSFELLTNAVKRRQLRDDSVRFPSPPFAGSDGIVPISTARGLFSEGTSMQNCVYSMKDRVLDGGVYFYHLANPAHTVGISRDNQLWRLFEARTVGNGQAERGVVEDLLNWLAAEQGVQPGDVNGIESDPAWEEGL